jgi:S1-C subfamily serine protease
VILKLAVAATLVVGQIPAVPAVQPANVDDAQLLRCGNRSGTVWRISGDRYITAHHVSGDLACNLDGRPIRTIMSDESRDFAVLSTARGVGREYEIDCRGFVAGQLYRAVGWAGGSDLLAMPVISTGQTWVGQIGGEPGRLRQFHHLRGGSYPGMSGGPIISREGKVVGIVNAGNSMGTVLSRPLSETALCNGGA